MTMSSRKIKLSRVMKMLALRSNADFLFDSIDKSKEKKIILDFSEIQFMSRSFAQQYFLRKKQSSKKVTEINVPKNIAKMFDLVKKSRVSAEFKAKDFEIIEVAPTAH